MAIILKGNRIKGYMKSASHLCVYGDVSKSLSMENNGFHDSRAFLSCNEMSVAIVEE